MLAEHFLNLAQLGRLQRAGIATAGEHEIDGNHLALDDVIVETQCLAILINQRGIGEVVYAPIRSRAGWNGSQQ